MKSKPGHLICTSFMAILLSFGNLWTGCVKEGSRPSLHDAVAERDYPAVLDLLRRGSCLEETDSGGCTPLHVACGLGAADIVSALLTHGASVKARDYMQSTPLHYAKTGEVADLLLKSGADVDARNRDGETILQCAAYSGSQVLLNTVLKYNPEIDSKGRGGYTPLLLALYHDRVENARIILAHGADPSLANEKGVSPISYVKKQIELGKAVDGFPELLQVMIQTDRGQGTGFL